MKLKLYRVTRRVQWEYRFEREVDTGEIPECKELSVGERLEWLADNHDRIWDGEFTEWLYGEECEKVRHAGQTDDYFLYGKPVAADNYEDVYSYSESAPDYATGVRKVRADYREPGVCSKYPTPTAEVQRKLPNGKWSQGPPDES